MPAFIEQDWNGYKLRIIPRDCMRYFLRFVPYFYGPLSFNLVVCIRPQKDVTKEILEYQWMLCRSEDDSQVKLGQDTIRFAEAVPYDSNKNKNGDVARSTKIKFTKIGAVDLKHMSKLGQYKIIMNFIDSAGIRSEDMIMMEFTLEDRDHYSLNLASVLLGAVSGAAAGGIVGFVVAVLTKGQ